MQTKSYPISKMQHVSSISRLSVVITSGLLLILLSCGCKPPTGNSTKEEKSQTVISAFIPADCFATQDTPKEQFEYTVNEFGSITITKYIGQDENVRIPAEIDGKPVTEIGKKLKFSGVTPFYNCTFVKTVFIPDGVKLIGYRAFGNCKSLSDVFIPSSVVEIADSFWGCESLKGWQVSPDNPKFTSSEDCLLSKDGTTLLACPSASGEYHVPSEISVLEQGVFDGCTSLTSVVIQNNTTKLAATALGTCKNLTIRAPKGSTAETFAKEQNLKFEELQAKAQ